MSHVTLGTSKQKTSKLGSFVAVWFQNGKSNRTKTVGIEANGHEIAYETVDLWAEDLAKKEGIKYNKKTFEELKDKLQRSVDGLPKIIDTSSIKSNLSNIKLFKMEMRRAFKKYGADKIREVLKEGTKLLGELQREKVKIEKNSGKAKAAVALAMYQTWVDTSVDTSIYCTDDEIVNEFNRLKSESKQGNFNV